MRRLSVFIGTLATAPALITSFTPRSDVPKEHFALFAGTLAKWKLLDNGSIQGIVRNHPTLPDGQVITTSPIDNPDHAKAQTTVRSAIGSEYNLDQPAPPQKKHIVMMGTLAASAIAAFALVSDYAPPDPFESVSWSPVSVMNPDFVKAPEAVESLEATTLEETEDIAALMANLEILDATIEKMESAIEQVESTLEQTRKMESATAEAIAKIEAVDATEAPVVTKLESTAVDTTEAPVVAKAETLVEEELPVTKAAVEEAPITTTLETSAQETVDEATPPGVMEAQGLPSWVQTDETTLAPSVVMEAHGTPARMETGETASAPSVVMKAAKDFVAKIGDLKRDFPMPEKRDFLSEEDVQIGAGAAVVASGIAMAAAESNGSPNKSYFQTRPASPMESTGFSSSRGSYMDTLSDTIQSPMQPVARKSPAAAFASNPDVEESTETASTFLSTALSAGLSPPMSMAPEPRKERLTNELELARKKWQNGGFQVPPSRSMLNGAESTLPTMASDSVDEPSTTTASTFVSSASTPKTAKTERSRSADVAGSMLNGADTPARPAIASDSADKPSTVEVSTFVSSTATPETATTERSRSADAADLAGQWTNLNRGTPEASPTVMTSTLAEESPKSTVPTRPALETTTSNEADKSEYWGASYLDLGYMPAAATASALCSSSTQVDAAPVEDKNDLSERLKMELELVQEWQTSDRTIKRAPAPTTPSSPTSAPNTATAFASTTSSRKALETVSNGDPNPPNLASGPSFLDMGYMPAAATASALCSSGTQVDADAPVLPKVEVSEQSSNNHALAAKMDKAIDPAKSIPKTKVERLKMELELARQWQRENLR